MKKDNNSSVQASEIFEKLKANDFKNFEGLDDLINNLSSAVDTEVGQAIQERDLNRVYRDLHDGCDKCTESTIYRCEWDRPVNSCPKKVNIIKSDENVSGYSSQEIYYADAFKGHNNENIIKIAEELSGVKFKWHQKIWLRIQFEYYDIIDYFNNPYRILNKYINKK